MGLWYVLYGICITYCPYYYDLLCVKQPFGPNKQNPGIAIGTLPMLLATCRLTRCSQVMLLSGGRLLVRLSPTTFKHFCSLPPYDHRCLSVFGTCAVHGKCICWREGSLLKSYKCSDLELWTKSWLSTIIHSENSVENSGNPRYSCLQASTM